MTYPKVILSLPLLSYLQYKLQHKFKKTLVVEHFNIASMRTWMIAMIQPLRFILQIYYDKCSIIISGSWVANILLKHIKSTVEYTWEPIKKSSLGRCWSNCLLPKGDHLRNTYTEKSLRNIQQKIAFEEYAAKKPLFELTTL